MTQEQDKERAAFEAWQTNMLKRDLQELARGGSVTGEYDDIDVHNEWTAWQARAALAAPQPNAALAEGWTSVKDRLPPCTNDQDYIGINSAGFAGIFNAIADINDNVYCMMETAEDSVSIMSDLALWKPFERPPAPPTLNASKEAGNG